MNLFVDTSVWSLALRRDQGSDAPEVVRLHDALASREPVFTTGLVLQELLQGFRGPKARDAIVERFSVLPTIVPDRDDHIVAAEIRNTCRCRGVQVGTIDTLLIRLCIRHELSMLSCDDDFRYAARHVTLKHGYTECGCVPDFHGDGDGKITFVRNVAKGPRMAKSVDCRGHARFRRLAVAPVDDEGVFPEIGTGFSGGLLCTYHPNATRSTWAFAHPKAAL